MPPGGQGHRSDLDRLFHEPARDLGARGGETADREPAGAERALAEDGELLAEFHKPPAGLGRFDRGGEERCHACDGLPCRDGVERDGGRPDESRARRRILGPIGRRTERPSEAEFLACGVELRGEVRNFAALPADQLRGIRVPGKFRGLGTQRGAAGFHVGDRFSHRIALCENGGQLVLERGHGGDSGTALLFAGDELLVDLEIALALLFADALDVCVERGDPPLRGREPRCQLGFRQAPRFGIHFFRIGVRSRIGSSVIGDRGLSVFLKLRAQLLASAVQGIEFELFGAEFRARIVEAFGEFGDLAGGIVAVACEAVDLREQAVARHADGLVCGFQLGDLHSGVLAHARDHLQAPAEFVPLGAEFFQHLDPHLGSGTSGTRCGRRDVAQHCGRGSALGDVAVFRDDGLGRHVGFLI